MRFFQLALLRTVTLIIAVVAAPILAAMFVLDALLNLRGGWRTTLRVGKSNLELVGVFYTLLWKFWNAK